MPDYYVVHIATRDGDKEYLETTIMCLPELPSDNIERQKLIIEEFTCENLRPQCHQPQSYWWYVVENCYRHYRCEQIQKVQDEHVEILKMYNI